MLASIGILGLVVSGLVLRRAAADRSPPTLSIGPLADHRPAPGDDLRGPLRDLLATSLGRSPTVRVVSTARMYELLGDRAPESDLPLSTWAEVAREAGASEVVDGALYALPDGRLQLDLRRLDLRNGRVLGTARAQATDAFALADSATALLLAGMGVEQPRGSIASLTTGSLVAYRLYEQGLRRYIRRDYTSALHLLLEALREDSSFAMAALYAAKATRDFQERLAFMRQAFHLADRATERERLLIRAQAAILMSDPALNGYIDSLVTRFPGEVEGYLFAGIARAGAGQYLSALPYLERVVALDSGAANLGTGECRICEALSYITGAYHSLDSMAAAETHARRTIRLVPEYANGWATLSEILSIRGRYQESEDAAVAFDRLAPGINLALRARSHNLIRSGRAGEAASLMTGEAAIASGERRLEALWFAVIALREAGRGDEALELALQLRREFTSPAGIAGSSSPMMHAAALEAGGDPRAAAALFDSIAREPVRGDIPSHAARTRAWAWTQAASALAAAGDTTRLAALADSIAEQGARSGFVRDQLLHHHVRGLLSAARGRDSLALRQFYASLYSLSTGNTRTNVAAARLHLKRGEVRQAIALLEPALDGSLEASNLYQSRREIHALLARAWAAAGDPDRAAHHRAFLSPASP